jgi:2-methylcitrate dehydratase
VAATNAGKRPAPDQALVDIARYVARKNVGGAKAYDNARLCLMDALGCAMQAFAVPECMKLVGPIVPGTVVPGGARVPGTQYQLDPVSAAFSTGCLIRWLDFNDTWWAGGHPSDNFSAILAVADYVSRRRITAGKPPLVMRDVLTAAIKAYEIHGVLAEGNIFNSPEIGLDLVILLKIASTAVITHILGGGVAEITDALSNAFVDGQPLNTYRVMPNAGPRKSWASGDATARAVQLALMTMRGEMGYPTALSAKTWGFCDVLNKGRALKLSRAYGSHVIENVQFKIAYPAQRHSQTAAECAVRLHPLVKDRIDDIDRVVLTTHAPALAKIVVDGPLPNFAARDHCLQYVVAIGLLFGDITNASYEDVFAADPRIDRLRAKMTVRENKGYTRDYHGARQANHNAAQVFFRDGAKTPQVDVEFLIGDKRRRREALPLLERKFKANLAARFAAGQCANISALLGDQRRLEATPVDQFMDLLSI